MNLEIGHVGMFERIFSQQDFDRFAELSRDYNPIHVDPAFSARTRFGSTVAHGMLLYGTICHAINTCFPEPGILQIKQELMFRHPTFTDTEVTVRLEVRGIRPNKKEAEIDTDILLPDGNFACRGKTLVLVPGCKSGYRGVDRSFQISKPTEADRFRYLQIGQKEASSRTFSREDLKAYAQLTGDDNPLFCDETFARQAGFKRCLVPGPLLSGMFSELLGTRLPGRGTNWLKQILYFPAAAYVYDEIRASVEIVGIRPEKNLINLRDTCTNSAGELVCQAHSLVLVQDLE